MAVSLKSCSFLSSVFGISDFRGWLAECYLVDIEGRLFKSDVIRLLRNVRLNGVIFILGSSAILRVDVID